MPQLTANHFLLMRLTALPTETVSIVPAHVSVDHALAGRGDRHEHHFLVACRTTRKNRRDAVRRFAYCTHVRTSLVPVCEGCPYHNGRMQNKFRLGHGFFKLKLGHCEIQLRPLGPKNRPVPADPWDHIVILDQFENVARFRLDGGPSRRVSSGARRF